MSETTTPPQPATPPQTPPLVVNIQYVKDLSFEVPGAPQVFSQLRAQPQVNINLDVQARLRDAGAWQLLAGSVVLEREHGVIHADQAPLVLLPTGQPATHALADRPAKLSVLPELAIQPRRRHFEIVRLLDETGSVQHVAQLAAGAPAIFHPDTVRLVDEHP